MPSDPIVEALRLFKDGLPGLCPALEGGDLNAFGLECAKERLRDGIIVAVVRSTHAHCNPSRGQEALIGITGILRALVRE